VEHDVDRCDTRIPPKQLLSFVQWIDGVKRVARLNILGGCIQFDLTVCLPTRKTTIGWLEQMNLTGTPGSAQVFVRVPKLRPSLAPFGQPAGVRL
jgi:hypothetical protein